MFFLSCRAPTCFLTPQACQMTPSLEPATCGPRWSLHATLLLTTTLMRSPHRTARNDGFRACEAPEMLSSVLLDADWVVWMHNSSGLLLTVVGGRPQSTLTLSSAQHEGASVCPDTTHTHACTVCVCVCIYTSRERQPVQSQDCLHIYLP